VLVQIVIKQITKTLRNVRPQLDPNSEDYRERFVLAASGRLLSHVDIPDGTSLLYTFVDESSHFFLIL